MSKFVPLASDDAGSAYHAQGDAHDGSARPRRGSIGVGGTLEVVGQATVPGTTFNLVNNIVGSGMLSLPWTLQKTSAIVGVIALVGTGMLNHYTALLTARCCVLTKAYTYRELGLRALGPRAGNFIQGVMLCYTLGSCISYIVLIGDFVPHVMAAVLPAASNRIMDILVISACLLLPLSLLKDLNKLRFTSAAALVCIAYTTLLIVVNFISADEYAPSVKAFHFEKGVFASLPIANVAFTLHYNAPRYFQELKDRTIPTLRRATLTAFTVCILVYCFSAIGGYMVFGDDTEGNILNNYDDDDIAADIARMALTFVIVFTYPLAFFSFRASVLEFSPTWLRTSTRTRDHVWVTVALLSLTTLVGILVPSVQVVLGLNGAVNGTFMVYIFPALMYSSLRAQAEKRRAGGLLVASDAPGVELVAVGSSTTSQAVPADEDHVDAALASAAKRDEEAFVPGLTPVVPGSDVPLWHNAVHFMRTKEGLPFAALVAWGVVVGFLGVLVTIGVL